MAKSNALKAIGSTSKTVGEPCAEYTTMCTPWGLIDDLLGGREAMIAAGALRLPKEEEESEEGYRERLQRTFLFPGYEDAATKLISKPFQKPTRITAPEKLHRGLQLIENDADNMGTSISSFAKELFADAFHRGLSHFYVDYPRRNGKTTEADVNQHGVHPYFVHVKAEQVIGWRRASDPESGKEVLTQVRIVEHRSESDGDWGEKTVRFVRVWNTDSWELWRETDQAGVFALQETAQHSLGRVPLRTYYVRQTGFMTGKPALLGLAELNLQHWQESSDKRNSEHYASIPILHQTGVEREKLKTKLVIGARRTVRSNRGPSDTSLEWVESSGSASGQIGTSIEKIEARMQTLGMAPLLERAAARTATEAGAEREDSLTTMHLWVGALNDALYDGYDMARSYVGAERTPLDPDFAVMVFAEWQIAIGDDAGIKTAIDMRREGLISHRTALIEVQRRGYFSEAFDVDKELEDVADAGLPQLPDENDTKRMDELRKRRAAREAAGGAA